MASSDPQKSETGALARVPVTVLTGFLGAGKTTLLNALLREPHGFRVAVIVNEFGEVGIDGARIAGAEQFVQLDNGCLCCAINEDLKRTLAELREHGGFDHLVIETTGLADPLPVAWTFSRPNLGDFYRIDAIVTLADAVNLERALAEAPEAALQIERADLIVLSKVDLTADGGAAARARLHSLQPRAPILTSEPGQIPWQILLSSRNARATEAPSSASGTAPHSSDSDHAHEHALAGSHAHAPHTPSFASWVFRTRATVSEAALEDLLFALPDEVYRVKGLLRADGESDWVLVNAVAGRFEIEPFDPSPAPEESALVFLGRDLDAQALSGLCEDLVRAPSSPSR